jgi:hypothetical protein
VLCANPAVQSRGRGASGTMEVKAAASSVLLQRCSTWEERTGVGAGCPPPCQNSCRKVKHALTHEPWRHHETRQRACPQGAAGGGCRRRAPPLLSGPASSGDVLDQIILGEALSGWLGRHAPHNEPAWPPLPCRRCSVRGHWGSSCCTLHGRWRAAVRGSLWRTGSHGNAHTGKRRCGCQWRSGGRK